MRSDVAKYVRKCQVRLSVKSDLRPPAGLMGQHPRVTRPWQMVSVDLCGPLPRSTSGHRYILVVQDYFSKFVLLHPLRDASASACVKYLEEQVS